MFYQKDFDRLGKRAALLKARAKNRPTVVATVVRPIESPSPGSTVITVIDENKRVISLPGVNTGVIFEEISTTYFNGDSIYKDQALNEMDRSARKTKLVNWGFHHFD